MHHPFHSLYSHGFIRTAVCIPFVRVADPAFNVERTLGLARRASELHSAVALFPELGLSAYSNEDLFHQDALLGATETALARLVQESRDLAPVLLVGAPLRLEGKLFNCGVVMYHRALCAMQSAKCIAAYLYAAAGPGESTTDLAWDGQALIYENNDLLAEAERFASVLHITTAAWPSVGQRLHLKEATRL